jgi:hypothetical protein
MTEHDRIVLTADVLEYGEEILDPGRLELK